MTLTRIYFYQTIQVSPAFPVNVLYCKRLEKPMAPHSSTLAWKIPWTEEPGGLQSMGWLESDVTERLHFHALEKEMATHSSVLAWRIPGTGKPAGLPSMGSHRVGHDWSDLAAAAAAALQKMSLGLCIACVVFHQSPSWPPHCGRLWASCSAESLSLGFLMLHDSFQAIPFKKNFTSSNAMFSNVSYQVTQNL